MNEIDFQRDLLPHKQKLYRLALRITLDPMEAEDIVEDILVRTWERRSTLLVQQLDAYLLTACRNLALDRVQRQSAQTLSLSDCELQTAAPELSAEENMARQERHALLHRLVDALPEKQRTALQLRDIEGYSYAQVAELMQVSEADVKVSLHRARQSLKTQLLRLREDF